MNQILNYLPLIVLAVLFCAAAAFAVMRFAGLGHDEQIEQVKAWLLSAVTWAEATYGGGTGSIKLSEVYALFCKDMPWIAKLMSFETFSALVDEALIEMRELIQYNKNVRALVVHNEN